MVKTIYICDRCGDEIERHPKKIKKAFTESSIIFARINIADITDENSDATILNHNLKYDLCINCRNDFLNKFIKGV